MSTTEDRVVRLTGMDLWDEYDRLMDEVKALGGPALAGRLSDVVTARLTEAENKAVRTQGAVILAAIRGDLVAWDGCDPQWDDRPVAP